MEQKQVNQQVNQVNQRVGEIYPKFLTMMIQLIAWYL